MWSRGLALLASGCLALGVAAFSPLPAAATTPVGSAWTCPAATYGVHSSAPGSGKTVALTFDDGPGASTPQILAILRAKGVRATFFNLGVAAAQRPQDVISEVNGGDVVANHTWDHKQLTTLTASAQAAELDRASAEQAALVGRLPCLLRPPYGSYNATTLTLAQQRRMNVYTWSVDPEDWKAGTSTAAYWVIRIVSRAEAGASQSHPVILLHNQAAGNPATVAALGTVIDFYRARGYTFVDLYGRGGYPTGSAVGAYDRLTRWPGGLRVDGWAVDPSSTTASTLVDVYVDGTGHGRYVANGYRPDVAAVFPSYGTHHGFTVTFPYTPAGGHRVCLYAVNTVGPGDDRFLGCRVTTISNTPFGHLDRAVGGSGTVTLDGWAIDPDLAGTINVVPYVDGRALAAHPASGYRPDVGAAYPGWGNYHGFRFTVAVTHGTHTVCVNAVNVGPGANTAIRCTTVTS